MNNQLANLLGQLRGVWKQLGINQRLTILFTGLLVLGGIGSLVFWSTRHDYALLYGKLEETEAAKVLAALDEAKIPYEVSRSGGSIMVPRDKVHVMRMQLAAKGIPKGEGVGFEIFDKSNFGISDFVQRANYLRALQGELARTISQVDLVENARVMLVIPENRIVVDDKKRATGSVFVKVRGNVALPAQTVAAIRFLVANSVEGLQPDHVSVVDNLGNVLSENSDSSSTAGLTQTQLSARKNLEQYFARKAEGMLEAVLGQGQAVVRVSTEINFDTSTRTEEKFDPDSAILRSSTINDENTDSSTASVNGGSPGVQANSNTETNLVATPLNNNKMKKKVTTSQFEINKVTSNLVQNGGAVSRITAAVFIAAKVEGSGATRKVVPRTPEEVEKLRKIVQTALGIQAGADGTRKDEITLEEMPFNDQPAQEMMQKMDTQERRQFWMQLLGNTTYPLMALAVLAVFWRAFKKAPAVDIPLGIPIEDFAEAKANGNGKTNGMHPKRGKQPAVTVEVMNQLIRENPQNMTQAIRTWMTRGQ